MYFFSLPTVSLFPKLTGFGWFQKVQILIGLELKTATHDRSKSGGGGSDVKMGCTIYWKNFPR